MEKTMSSCRFLVLEVWIILSCWNGMLSNAILRLMIITINISPHQNFQCTIPKKSWPSPHRELEREGGVLFSRSFNSRKFKTPCFLIIHNKKTRFQYQSLYIVFWNCRGTGGILWLFPSMVEKWIFWNHSIRGPNSPPEKHLKCHNKMAGNISVARFHLTFQDGGEHIS